MEEAGGARCWPIYLRLLDELHTENGSEATAAASIELAHQPSSSSSAAAEVQQIAWQQLHSGHWADVSLVWRRLYERAGLAEVLMLRLPTGAIRGKEEEEEEEEENASSPSPPLLDSASVVSSALRTLDLCLLMGSQDAAVVKIIHALVAQLEAINHARSSVTATATTTAATPAAPALSTAAATPVDRCTRKRRFEIGDSTPSAEATKSKHEHALMSAAAASASLFNDAAAAAIPASPAAASSSSCPLPCPPVLPSSRFARPVPRLSLPSLQTFQRACMASRTPTILSGVMDHWPCMAAPPSDGSTPDRRWSDLRYIQRLCGRRTVPVEIGAHYMEQQWSQKLMTVDEFIQQHIIQQTTRPPSSSSAAAAAAAAAADTAAASSVSSTNPTAAAPSSPTPVGYLAQHRLFEQVPALRNDILVPDYCLLSLPSAAASATASTSTSESSSWAASASEPDGEPAPPQLLAWFGPCGTLSPLHFDPSHNLLAQVVGSKYVRLYAQELSDKLYPHDSRSSGNSSSNSSSSSSSSSSGSTATATAVPAASMANTSQIDVERLDAQRFPAAVELPYWECILRGE